MRQCEIYACAIGAAATAKEPRFPFLTSDTQMEFIENEFPEIVYGKPTIADMKGLPYLSASEGWTFYAAIGRMNDENVLSREEIADWLERIGH